MTDDGAVPLLDQVAQFPTHTEGYFNALEALTRRQRRQESSPGSCLAVLEPAGRAGRARRNVTFPVLIARGVRLRGAAVRVGGPTAARPG